MKDAVVPGKGSRKGSLWRTVKAVAWSFVGLRKGSEYQEDIAQLSPLHIIAVGIVGCFVFVISMMFFVQWVVAK